MSDGFSSKRPNLFFNLDDERREWHVFVTTPNGAKLVPVYVDEEKSFDETVILVEDKKKQNIVNLKWGDDHAQADYFFFACIVGAIIDFFTGTIAPFEGSAAAFARTSTSCWMYCTNS